MENLVQFIHSPKNANTNKHSHPLPIPASARAHHNQLLQLEHFALCIHCPMDRNQVLSENVFDANWPAVNVEGLESFLPFLGRHFFGQIRKESA
jgi:hypothetical protein